MITQAADVLFRDETPPIRLALADPAVPPEPLVLTERLALYGSELWVITEDQGGGIESELNLGELTDVSDWDVPEHLRTEFYRIIDEEREAIEYGAACRAEALRRY